MTVIPPQRPHPHFIELDDLDKSAIEGLYSTDITQYQKITKLTLQKYLEACIHPKGQFRKFFENFASFTANYVVNEALTQDPQQRHIQIARYFDRMAESPPQIFIQDKGYDYTPASLGSLTEGWNTRSKNGEQIVRIMDVVPLPIDITCAALSEQECDDLCSFITAAFGQYQRFTCNYVLKPVPSTIGSQGVYWEVRIPLMHSMGAKAISALHGDPRLRIYQATCSMTIEFENSSYIQYRAAPLFEQQPGTMTLDVPDKIRLRQKTTFNIHNMRYPVSVYSDNNKIAAIFSYGTSFMIRPKRIGKFKILVVKSGTNLNPEIPLLEKEIEVVIR